MESPAKCRGATFSAAYKISTLGPQSESALRTVYLPLLDVFWSGVRQGCILAPALFCCTTEWLMSRCKDKLGVDVGSGTFTDLDYADDGVMFTGHPDNWNEVLTDYKAAANTLGRHANWMKTKVQNTDVGPGTRNAVQMSSQTVTN